MMRIDREFSPGALASGEGAPVSRLRKLAPFPGIRIGSIGPSRDDFPRLFGGLNSNYRRMNRFFAGPRIRRPSYVTIDFLEEGAALVLCPLGHLPPEAECNYLTVLSV